MRLFRKKAPIDPFNLDRPLLYFSPSDVFTIRDSFEGVQIFGGIGSGKTSGSASSIARALLRAGYGGLVLCVKREERRLWERYCDETGRSQDLIIISPKNHYRFNFLDYELRRKGEGAGLTENLVNLISMVIELVENKQDMGGGDRFWGRAMNQMIRNAVDLLALSKGTISLDAISRLIEDAPASPEQVGNENWQNSSFCAECIREADRREKSHRQQHDFDMAVRYWLGNFAGLDNRTRSNIVATFTSVADMLLHGMAWELLCTETNIVPEIAYKNGAVIVLDISIEEFDDVGRVIQAIIKMIYQRAVLRRDVREYPRPLFLYSDEAQYFVSSFDFKYQSIARSSSASTIYITQNLSNYHAILGHNSRDLAMAFLANLQTKIFHANTDYITNQFAADTIAQMQTMSYSYNSGSNDKGSSVNSGASETVRHKVMPAHFTTLRKGGPQNKREVEAIIFQGGRIWNATGDTYLKTIFKQGKW